ncbi:hypothetical protein [Burkholderia glumae]|uniref:hypothetical protein n=1 Tax=Burkholderia glumae TaxID=337 RepID=UPI001C27C4C8|nr:hypothetical protein [Burkholderia glumae]
MRLEVELPDLTKSTRLPGSSYSKIVANNDNEFQPQAVTITMRPKLTLATSAVAVCILSGCASITGGSTQVLSVQTTQGGKSLAGAQCTLANDKGTWFVTTPGTVPIHRAYDDLNVKCEKDGSEPGVLTVKSSTKGMAWGNILAGGVIGAAVDMGTGAAYDYPSLLTVSMGVTTTLSPPTKADPASPASTPQSTTGAVAAVK